MKRHLLSIIALSLGATLHAQTRADYNDAAGKFQHYYNDNLPDSVFSMFNERMKQLVSMDKTKEMFTQLNTKLGRLNSFEFTKEELPFSYYKASFKNAPVSLVFSLTKENTFESLRILPYESNNNLPKEKSNFNYNAPDGTIYGTLAMPATGKKVPVVLIIAGSGPTDRNGNQADMVSNCYKQLSDSLLKENIASVRYDKRGAGESIKVMKNEESTTFSDLVNDAEGFIKMLKGDSRFSKIIVLGHSEGSLIGMIVAGKEKVNGYISLSGAGESIDKILKTQLAAQSPAILAKASVIMDSLRKGYTVKNIDSDMYMLFRPSVQPYLRSWFKYDPVAEIKKLTVPVLILQGTTDIQVAVSDAQLLKKASPKAKLKLITGMNHVLKQAPADSQQNMATYNNPNLPLSTELMPAICAFINEAK